VIAACGVAREDRRVEIPDTRYAVTRDGVYLAYRRLGQGTIDMLVQFDWMGNVDTLIDVEPSTRALWRAVASYARVIFYDRRGTGLSSRNVSPPNLETAVADTQVVLDAGCPSVEHTDIFRTHPRYARRTAISRGVVRHVCRKRGRGVDSRNSLQIGSFHCPRGAGT